MVATSSLGLGAIRTRRCLVTLANIPTEEQHRGHRRYSERAQPPCTQKGKDRKEKVGPGDITTLRASIGIATGPTERAKTGSGEEGDSPNRLTGHDKCGRTVRVGGQKTEMTSFK